MVLIYIRHSDDSKKRQESSIIHRDDPSLTPEGRRLARRTGQKLIKHYGEPDIVYVSPFARAKQTLKEMLKYSEKKPAVYMDNRLSRYFSSREKKDPSCFTETFEHRIPIYENWNQFIRRVDKNIYQMKKKGYIEEKSIIWCITHALPFIQVAKVCKLKIPKSIPFMYYYRIRPHRIKYIDSYFSKK